MESDFGKYKILIVNIFVILLKMATLSPFKLQMELNGLKHILDDPLEKPFVNLILYWFLFVQTVIKFVFGYMTLATNLIAMFPILTEDLAKLLIPSMISQTLENLLLNSMELIVIYLTIKADAAAENSKMSIFYIFSTTSFIKVVAGLSALKVYTDFYQHLTLKKKSIDQSYPYSSLSKAGVLIAQKLNSD